MNRQSISIWFAAAVFAAVILVQLAGCTRGETATPAAAAPAPAVSVATVLSRQIADSDEFTGRFEAVERVEIRPRVTGYISSVNFVQGREVTKGDVLFVIDPASLRGRPQARPGAARTGPLAADAGNLRTGSRQQAAGRACHFARRAGEPRVGPRTGPCQRRRRPGGGGYRGAEPELHPGHRADHRRRQPRGNHGGQSRDQRPDAAHHAWSPSIRST